MFRRTLGIVFQDFRLIQNMTVYDNVAFAMRVIGAKEKEIRKRVPYILSLVGLSSKARQKPNQLSGGEQQRVALARALVNNAGLIIADEPTGNIDPEMSYEIVDLLNHINASGTTIVMVTHEHNLVRHFHHRVITIDQGYVVSDTSDSDKLPDDYSKYEAAHPSVVSPASESALDEERKKIVEEIVHEDIKVDENKLSSYYAPPMSDSELEDFISNYGVDVDEDTAEDDIDYSIYLDNLTEKSGGEDK